MVTCSFVLPQQHNNTRTRILGFSKSLHNPAIPVADNFIPATGSIGLSHLDGKPFKFVPTSKPITVSIEVFPTP